MSSSNFHKREIFKFIQVIPLTTNIVADTRQRKQLGSSNIAILLGVFNKTIIPIALVGYEIVIGNSALRASLAIYHLISNARL